MLLTRGRFVVVHRWLGVVLALPLIVVALTGSILAFERQLTKFSNRDLGRVPVGTKRVSYDVMIAAAHQARPEDAPKRFTVTAEADEALVVETKGGYRIYVNPYTGVVVGERAQSDDIVWQVEELHASLFLPSNGDVVCAISALCVLANALFGFVVWWPRGRDKLRGFRVARGKPFSAMLYDLHAAAGGWAGLMLILLATTGAVHTFKKPVRNFIGSITGERAVLDNIPQAPESDAPVSYDAILASPIAEVCADAMQVMVGMTAPYRLTCQKVGRPYTSVYFDPHAMTVLAESSTRKSTWVDAIYSLDHPVHTGTLGGVATQIVWSLAALVIATLPVTGVLAFARKRRERAQSSRRVARTLVAVVVWCASAAAVASEPDARAARIDALMDGSLAAEIEPQSLFDVRLDDADAIAVERVRIEAVLAPPRNAARDKEIAGLDSDLWKARLALDQSRLRFYELPAVKREALLFAQAKRREAARPPESDDEKRAREAEEERQRIVEAARQAHSEGERLVAEELARLITIEQAIATLRDGFAEQRAELDAQRDALIGWQHRAREARNGTPADADATYDALRRNLRTSRDALDEALEALQTTTSVVPELGPNALDDAPESTPADDARSRRESVQAAANKARVEEGALKERRATTLLDQIDTLNHERLALLPFLSEDKRDAITGFSAAGLDQARAETRHLFLVLRYHRHIAGGWLRSVQHRDGIEGFAPWRAAGVAVPWVLATIAFIWWRRRSVVMLASLETKLTADDHRERRLTPSPLRRTVRFVRRVRSPIEWLLFLEAMKLLLPSEARGLLEVQLFSVIVGWALGAALVIDAINAVATLASNMSGARFRKNAESSEALRIRSLRLVGRVVVAFVLILHLSARLVGKGTVYSWTLVLCWFAAIPVFLLLVRWWRATVFDRVERLRRKTALQEWVLVNRSGWKSFFAAMIAAVQLFAVGTFKTVWEWLASFNIARRAHAYLFRRELSRRTHETSNVHLSLLADDELSALAPDGDVKVWVPSAADDVLDTIEERIASGRGGVVALIGGLGQGKSALLNRLQRDNPDAFRITCRVEDDSAALHERLESARQAKLVLVDDVEALVQPIFGGLLRFDTLLEGARDSGSTQLFVFAIDSIVWPFLSRARDNRPLFDAVLTLTPWNDAEIGSFLLQRSEEAGLEPTFEDLLEKLAPNADAIDKQDALAETRIGYFRLVWDYARGNPAIALELWRKSLVRDASGVVRVRSPQSPDASTLERLPDSALFVLRAVLQLAPAATFELAQATRLTESQVENALRFGLTHGYFVRESGRTTVAWPWVRPIMRLLERRHMVVVT